MNRFFKECGNEINKKLEINPFRSLQNKSIVEGGITANLSGLNKKRMSYPTSSGVFYPGMNQQEQLSMNMNLNMIRIWQV